MGGKNTYLQVQKEMFGAGWEAGMSTGLQFAWDCFQLTLRDHEAVGKDTFGKGRISKVFNIFRKNTNYFAKALHNEVESDVVQEQLDRLLSELWKDELVPFKDRYEHLRPIDYKKPKKKMVDKVALVLYNNQGRCSYFVLSTYFAMRQLRLSCCFY